MCRFQEGRYRLSSRSSGPGATSWSHVLVIELTLAFVVFCADSIDRETRRSSIQHLARALCWPVPLTRWFTHRNLTALGRFGAVVWFLVTSGWLISLEYDRIHPTPVFLVLAETTMGFVVYCVDAMSSDLQRHRGRRVLRSAVWVKPVIDYLRDAQTSRSCRPA